MRTDPFLGKKNVVDQSWHTFASNHGDLIEFTLLELIRASPGWIGKKQFSFIESETERKSVFDHLVYNPTMNIALLIECKRHLSNVSGPCSGNILKYIDISKKYKNEILKNISMKNGKLHFCIFDAYGSGPDFYRDTRIIRPDTLSLVFPTCVHQAWLSIEREVWIQAKQIHQYDFPTSLLERVKIADPWQKIQNRLVDEKYSTDEVCQVSTDLNSFFSPTA